MSKKNRNKQNQQVAPVQETVDTELEKDVLTPEEPETTENVDQEEIESLDTEEVEEKVDSEEETKETPVTEEQEQVVNNEQPIEQKTETKAVYQPIHREGVINVEPKSASQVAAAKAVVSPAVEKFNELSEKYINIMSGPIDEDAKRCGIAILANIARHIIMSTDVAVFDACFKFFVKQRAIMLNSTTVIDGINKYLDKGKIAKVVQFYVTFQTLAESKILNSKFTLNVTTIRRLFNNDALANWLLAKRSTR